VESGKLELLLVDSGKLGLLLVESDNLEQLLVGSDQLELLFIESDKLELLLVPIRKSAIDPITYYLIKVVLSRLHNGSKSGTSNAGQLVFSAPHPSLILVHWKVFLFQQNSAYGYRRAVV
jgi:hypothetical protein